MILDRNRIIELVGMIRKWDFSSEEETIATMIELEEGVPDPEVANYVHLTSMTPAEIADKVLGYKPIQLPPPDKK